MLSHPSCNRRSLDGAQSIAGEPEVNNLTGPPARWDLYDVTAWTLWPGDCRDFVQQGLTNASVNATGNPFIWSLPPNLLFDSLASHQDRPLTEKVTHKICDANGQNCH